MAPPKVDNEYDNQIQRAGDQLEILISGNMDKLAPLLLRLALHDAGIYGIVRDSTKYLIKGGPNGSIRNARELRHPSNKGLEEAVDLCEKVKEKNQKITYADLYQLAGVTAVKITGGPKIAFRPGREDSTQYPEEKELVSDESQLKEITERMDLEEKDMVALFGGLYYKETKTDSKFDNSYFIDLATKMEKSDKNQEQQEELEKNYPLLKGEFRQWVDKYAKDKEAFFKAYETAHKKVSERGMGVATSGKAGDTQTEASGSRNRVRLMQGIGIAVITTAIILGFFLSRRTK